MLASSRLHVVLGATGGVGQALVHALVAQGALVRAVNRTGHGQGASQVEVLAADLTNRTSALAACQEPLLCTTARDCPMIITSGPPSFPSCSTISSPPLLPPRRWIGLGTCAQWSHSSPPSRIRTRRSELPPGRRWIGLARARRSLHLRGERWEKASG